MGIKLRQWRQRLEHTSCFEVSFSAARNLPAVVDGADAVGEYLSRGTDLGRFGGSYLCHALAVGGSVSLGP